MKLFRKWKCACSVWPVSREKALGSLCVWERRGVSKRPHHLGVVSDDKQQLGPKWPGSKLDLPFQRLALFWVMFLIRDKSSINIQSSILNEGSGWAGAQHALGTWKGRSLGTSTSCVLCHIWLQGPAGTWNLCEPLSANWASHSQLLWV